MGGRIGYIRVSTEGQNTARQEEMLKDCMKVFTEKVSGKNAKDRPELKKMMDFVREGDTVVVESYSRFARSTRDLLSLVEQLKDKGVSFVSLKENIDTNTPQGKFMLTVFAGLAEFEREQMLQRQSEGIAIAKAEGRYKGRKPIEINKEVFVKEYTAVKEGKQTAVQAMDRLGLKPNTYYRRVKAYGLN
jgi:DNA invertase Pin-like site-specific DNA recombinase